MEMAMKSEIQKDFDREAAQWDANPGRVQMADEVSAAMIREVPLTPGMQVMDFGCGTGLITLKLQPFVKTITGADSSQGMLAALQQKIVRQSLGNVFTRNVDSATDNAARYDLIVSSMTLHHVPDTPALFRAWFNQLRAGGQVCFADLDSEDGSFHSDKTGVFHFGFDREKLQQLLQEAGFDKVRATTATTINKEVKGQGAVQFPVFLITATRPE